MTHANRLPALALASLLLIPATASAVVTGVSASLNPLLHAIGYQTFENRLSGNNNSGILDDTADSNSTFDSTPMGSNNGGLYLTSSIGQNASNLGRQGRGQSTNNSFLQGPTFGSNTVPPGLNIVDVPLADGSAGTRLNMQGASASSWKFSQVDAVNQLAGDISITNESDFAFRLERIHFDARGLGAATSPDTLDLIYLATSTGSNLRNVALGTEVDNLKNFYNNTWTSTGVENVSVSVSSVISSASRINPGDSASFRFLWSFSGASGNGEAQLDNIAFSGTFLDPNNNFAPIDPVTFVIPEPSRAILALLGFAVVGFRRKR